MSEKIKLLIADDHKMFLDGLKLILKKQSELEVAAEAFNGHELLAYLSSQKIGLVITDLSMPGMKGIELVKAIKQGYPQVKLIVITMHNEPEIISEILQAEAEGYVLKNSGKADLLNAVNDVLNGKTHYDAEVIDLFLKNVKKEKKTEAGLKPLSERERQVLQLIIQEFTSKEIAGQLNISKQTVDTHRIKIMQKTGAKTLVGLIKFAIQSGFAN